MSASSSLTDAERRRAVASVVALTSQTRLAPQRYERRLRACFECGELTLEELTELMDTSVYQLLYHSQATAKPTEAELQLLLERARRHNAEHYVTGVLLYSDGRYVQLLEGPEEAVQAIFTLIKRDPRHTQVVTLGEGRGPRRLPAWSMGFNYVDLPPVSEIVKMVEEQKPLNAIATDPLLKAVLQCFV